MLTLQRTVRTWCAVFLTLFPLVGQATAIYAREWPLTLSRPNAGAYHVALDTSVYEAVHWPDLNDVRVLDADGQEVPSSIIAAPQERQIRHTVTLPWFPLPLPDDNPPPAPPPASGVVAPTPEPPDPAWLIDARKLSGKLHTIVVEWKDPVASFDVGYNIEGSNDQSTWRLIRANVRLTQAHHQGRTLRNNRLDVDTSYPYVRVKPVQRNGNPAVRALRGEVLQTLPNQNWRWIEPARVQTPASDDFIYHTPGRFPVQRLQVRMPNNSVAAWTVFSRDGDYPTRQADRQSAWTTHVRNWRTLHVSDTSRASNPDQTLTRPVNDRQWRLRPDSGAILPTAPTLRLGYLPGSVIFLAQGRAPWFLVAGSAQRATPHAALERFPGEPAVARLGTGSARAGAVAYQHTTSATDGWKTWLLWGVLILGSLLVGGLALSLLRGQKSGS